MDETKKNSFKISVFQSTVSQAATCNPTACKEGLPRVEQWSSEILFISLCDVDSCEP